MTSPPPSLTVEVALIPVLAPGVQGTDHSKRTYIVVDVVRATTTLCMFFERGARQVLVASNVAVARAARTRLGTDYLLAGEVGGARPADFDLGNSPDELARWDLRGRTLVHATTNGTRALHACQGGLEVYAGSLRNARAVTAAALATLTSGAGAALPASAPLASAAAIHIICAGLGTQPAFDDTLCAGYLAQQLTRTAQERGLSYALGEGARSASAVCAQVLATVGLRSALGASAAGRAVADIGLEADLDWCAAVDATRVVPRVVGISEAGQLLVVEPYHHPAGEGPPAADAGAMGT
jgi:2-phosphosulfolactate phosphatase